MAHVRKAGIVACALALAGLGGCAGAHERECAEGVGPYGVSRCVLIADAAPEEIEVFCAWVAERHEGLLEVRCGDYYTRYETYETCMSDLFPVPGGCPRTLGDVEFCAELIVDEPCSLLTCPYIGDPACRPATGP